MGPKSGGYSAECHVKKVVSGREDMVGLSFEGPEKRERLRGEGINHSF